MFKEVNLFKKCYTCVQVPAYVRYTDPNGNCNGYDPKFFASVDANCKKWRINEKSNPVCMECNKYGMNYDLDDVFR